MIQLKTHTTHTFEIFLIDAYDVILQNVYIN